MPSSNCVAVLGSGSIGITHLKALAAIDIAIPIAVPQRAGRRTELAKAGYQTAVDLEDAVRLGAKQCIVATDTGRHVKDGIAALERGLDVLVEKPIAVDAPTAHHLNKRAADLGRKLFVGCVLRFSASLNLFSAMCNQVGLLHSVHIESRSYLPDWRPDRPYLHSYSAKPDEGGVLRDLIHEIDYACWLFGWPVSVQATVKNLGRLGIDCDELAGITWQTPAGCIVSIDLDYLSRPPRRRMTAYGEFGTLEWDGITGTVALEIQDDQDKDLKTSQSRAQVFQEQARAFLNTSCGTVDLRLASGDDGVKALAVCDTARLASESRREENVAYP